MPERASGVTAPREGRRNSVRPRPGPDPKEAGGVEYGRLCDYPEALLISDRGSMNSLNGARQSERDDR